MNRRTWQKMEQRVAEWFGGKRSGPMQDKDANDIKHDFLHVQCKHSTRHAIITIWDAAKRVAKKDGKTPVVALGVKGRPGFWLLVKESDLIVVANQRLVIKKEGIDN